MEPLRVMKKKLTLEEVERAIHGFEPAEKRRLLEDLPKLLQLHSEDTALLTLAEQSFDFWDNTEDAAYDSL